VRVKHLLSALLCAVAWPLVAQDVVRGDVIVAGLHFDPIENFPISNIRIHGRDGIFKSEVFSREGRLGEPMERFGAIYIGTRTGGADDAIERLDLVTRSTSTFATEVANVTYLSPGPLGGMLAVNGSGEIYRLSADGAVLYTRDIDAVPRGGGGIDLGPDGCTAFFAASGSLARWDSCTNTGAQYAGPNLAASSLAMRLLSDGTFLIAVKGLQPDFENRIIRVDQGGNLIQSYPIPGDALALDIDGASFWTNAGNNLFHVEIATGQILNVTVTGYLITGLSVVGETRAGLSAAAEVEVPTLTRILLMLLTFGVAVAALIKLR
jgi:hypothetical protein